MHIRKYVKWKQTKDGSMLTNTKTGAWMKLNANASFIFLQRFVNYNPAETIAENLKMKYPNMDCSVLLSDVKQTLSGFESSSFFSDDESDRGYINLIIPPYPLETLNIKTSDSCNLNCKHCLEGNRRHKEGLSFEQIKGVIDDASSMGANEIVLTGGEPFMRKEIVEIIDFIDSHQMKATVFTNGTIIPDDFFSAIKNKNVFIRVSLEGANAEINDAIRGAGSFDATVNTMRRCKENSIRFGVAITVNSANFATYKDVIDLAHRYGAEEIEASDIIDMGNASLNRDLLLTEDQLVQLRIETLTMMQNDSALTRGMGLNRPEYDLSFKRKESRLDGKCCNAGIANCVIDTNGDVYPCLMFVDTPEFVCGNILDTPFRDIWWDNPVFNKLRNLHMGDIPTCANCEVAEECAGGCRAIAYLKSGSILSPTDKKYCTVTKKSLDIFKQSKLSERVRETQEKILSEGKR